MSSQTATVEFNGQEFFLIEGRIDAYESAHKTADLLTCVRESALRKGLSTATAAAIARMHQAIGAAHVLHDCDYKFNFAALVGDQVICGVFEEAHNLRSGDVISAVVCTQGEVLYVHSLRRNSDNLLLLPATDLCGRLAYLNRCMRAAWKLTALMWIFFGAIAIGFLALDASGTPGLLFIMLFAVLVPPLFVFPMELWTYWRSDPSAGGYAEMIFKVYGIPFADGFDALKGMDFFSGPTEGFFALNCEKAFQEHRKRFEIAL
jgi:hypothetical protein